jgi:LysM repeat protein
VFEVKKIWNRYSYAIILIVLSFTIASMISINSNKQSQYIKVTVSEGDSLWKISQQYAGKHSLSNNQFVSWVKSHNNIDGDQIFPGEKIIIPVSKVEIQPTEFASGAGE